MKGACAGHVQRTALVDGARIGAQNAILCWCNTTLGINLRVHGAHNVKYKYPSGARKSNIPYWVDRFVYYHFPCELLRTDVKKLLQKNRIRRARTFMLICILIRSLFAVLPC